MATLQESIEVEVPVSTAYNQWTQFESFPQFMKGVESVEQIDETSLHFRTKVAGIKREYDAQILEQTPDHVHRVGQQGQAPQRRPGHLRRPRTRTLPGQRGARMGAGGPPGEDRCRRPRR